MRSKKRIAVCAAAALLLLLLAQGLAGCGHKAEDGGKVSIWTVPAVEKVLQDRPYGGTRGPAEIRVSAAGGEYESAQLVLTAETAVASYTVETADLTSAAGDVFSAKDILPYHEKYVETTATGKEYYTENGWYPDALLPMEAAVRAGENRIVAGENQAVYLTFRVPIGQPAGDYEGALTVKIGESPVAVPITLTVWDLTVSAEAHAKNIFLNEWTFAAGELDSTEEMFRAYNDKLIEYRLAPNTLLYNNKHSDEDIALFTELAADYAKDPRCSNFSLPYEIAYKNITVQVEGKPTVRSEETFDAGIFRKYIVSLVRKSIEENVNIIDKCVAYFRNIDEPQLWKLQERVKLICSDFTAEKAAVADEIERDESLRSDMTAELVESIRNMRNVVTTDYDPQYDGLEINYCPEFQYYDNAALRANYAAQAERWWYGCVNPNYPYPTYHIDDSLLSARILSWMQAEYGVVGNLYWAANSYAVGELLPEDFYAAAVHNSATNGEGFLFYPGARYGIYGPVATLRLEAIRDGLEEYELLTALQNAYRAVGEETGAPIGENDVVSYLGGQLYDGTRWASTPENFLNVRNSLASLSMLAASPAEVCLTDFSRSGTKFSVKVFAKNGYVPQADGRPLTGGTAYEGGRLYTVERDMETAGRTLTLSVETEGKSYELTIDLGGEMTGIGAELLQPGLTAYGTEDHTTDVAVSLANAALLPGGEGSALQLSFGAAPANFKNGVLLRHAALSAIGPDTKSLELTLYAEEETEFEISFMYRKGSSVGGRPIYRSVLAGTLAGGWQSVAIRNLNAYNWEKFGAIDHMLITIGGKGALPVTVYLKELLIYRT